MKIKIRYFTTRPRKNGAMRYYWQPDATLKAAGFKVERLPDDLPAAMARAQQLNTQVDQWRVSNTKPAAAPNSMRAVIDAYKKSRHFTKLSPRTQKDYDHYLALIDQWAGDMPAGVINGKMVQHLYEAHRLKSPRAAAYLIQVLRLLFSYAERNDMVPNNSNPARRPGLEYRAQKGTPWSAQQVAAFVAAADRMGHFTIGTAVMLNEWLGQRQGDIINLTSDAYRHGALHLTQRKTGSDVVLPIGMVPDIKARLEAQLKRNTAKAVNAPMLQNEKGKAYTATGFNTIFRNVRIEASKNHPDLSGLIFKDLRHTAVTRLAEAGCEIPQIAAITGHTFKSCQEIIDRYNIRTTKMAQEAFQRRLEQQQKDSEA